jgi:glucose/arabinose dehydrogenase
MIPRRAVVPLALAALVTIPAAFAACGDDDVPPPGANAPGGQDGGAADDVQVAAPPIPETTIDPCRGQPLPEGDHYVPKGMCARLVSARVSGLRQLTFAPNGDLFGVTGDAIHLFRDVDGDGFFTRDEITLWADTDGGGNGNNCHIDLEGGFIYAGSRDGVKRFAYAPGQDKGGEGEDVVVGQPRGGHGRRTVRVYDGFLYVDSGSAGNATNETSRGDYDTKRSVIKRFDLSKLVPGTPFQWDAGEIVTVGLRNPNGFSRNEITGKIYSVVNGLDEQRYKGADVHEDNPGEQVVEIAPGKKYGYPFCFTAQRVLANGNSGALVPPGTQLVNAGFAGNPHDDAWCAASSEKPTTFVQAHSAPLDIVFFDKQPRGALPEKWRGGAFIAFHGSWNRSTPTGYKVVWQPFNPDGTAPMPTSTETTTTFPYEVVFGGGDASGPKDGAWSWSAETGEGEAPRPAGVAISPVDGALYIASDQSGLLYRVGLKR